MNMDYNRDIERLLERYWQCQTTLEEEEYLRHFFQNKEIPPHLLRYKSLFIYQQLQQKEGLGADFETRLLLKISNSEVNAKRTTFVARFVPLFRVAVLIIVFLALGNMVRHAFVDVDNSGEFVTDSICKQSNIPSVAVSNKTDVERGLADSLASMNKAEALKK